MISSYIKKVYKASGKMYFLLRSLSRNLHLLWHEIIFFRVKKPHWSNSDSMLSDNKTWKFDEWVHQYSSHITLFVILYIFQILFFYGKFLN